MANSTLKIAMTKTLGNIPYVYKLCNDIGLKTVIDAIVPPFTQNGREPTIGDFLTTLVVNRLTGPTPLYRVEDWAQKTGFDLYFPCSAAKLNDDKLGRVLDHSYPYLNTIKEQLVLQMVKKYHIDPSAIHYDLTSIFFEGEYDSSENVTLGYSRDHRSDHVQINLGLNVTDREKFPVWWQALAGNTQDTTTVIQNMERLKALFPRTNLIQIGDRAMFSYEILQQARQYHIDLISPLKKNVNAEKLLETITCEQLPIIIKVKDQNTIKYRLGEFTLSLFDNRANSTVRAIVVWSKAKTDAAAKNQATKIGKRRD